MNIREALKRAIELDKEYAEQYPLKIERMEVIAKEVGLGCRTSLRKAFEVLEYGNDEYIDLVENEVESLHAVWKRIRVESGKELPEVEVQRRLIKQLELDEEAASEKIASMYATIQDLKEENRQLKQNPTTEQLEKEQAKRRQAESALNDMRLFFAGNPAGANPEAIKFMNTCDLIAGFIPEKDSIDTRFWSDMDKKDCAASLKAVLDRSLELLEALRIA